MKRKFDGTFEGGAFEDDFGWSRLVGSVRRRISPEVIQAFAVILGALLEERPDRAQAEREHLEHERASRERMRRAEEGVRKRRQNAKKKSAATAPSKKRKAKRK